MPILPCCPCRSSFNELKNRFAEVKSLVWVQWSAAELGLESGLSVALRQLQRGQERDRSGREQAGVWQAEGSALLIQRLLWA